MLFCFAPNEEAGGDAIAGTVRGSAVLCGFRCFQNVFFLGNIWWERESQTKSSSRNLLLKGSSFSPGIPVQARNWCGIWGRRSKACLSFRYCPSKLVSFSFVNNRIISPDARERVAAQYLGWSEISLHVLATEVLRSDHSIRWKVIDYWTWKTTLWVDPGDKLTYKPLRKSSSSKHGGRKTWYWWVKSVTLKWQISKYLRFHLSQLINCWISLNSKKSWWDAICVALKSGP